MSYRKNHDLNFFAICAGPAALLLIGALASFVTMVGCLTIDVHPSPGSPEVVTNIIQVITNAIPTVTNSQPAETASACSCSGRPCSGNPAHKSPEGGTTLPGIKDFRIGADSDQVIKYSPFGRSADKWMCVTRTLMKAGAVSGAIENGMIVIRAKCVTVDGIMYHGLGFTLDSSADPLITPETRPDLCRREGDTLILMVPRVGRTVRYETVRIKGG